MPTKTVVTKTEELPEEGFSNIKGKLWKVWFAKIISVEEKIAGSFTEDQRKTHRALDIALKGGQVRRSDSVMLVVVRDLEKIQVILNWADKFGVKPIKGQTALMFYGRYGYTFPDRSFGKLLQDGFNVDIQK